MSCSKTLRKNLRLILSILVFFTACSLISTDTQACTVFYINKDGVILGGNNEEWEDPYTIFRVNTKLSTWWGDPRGKSIIVEANWYQSHPYLGGFPCRRYDAAVDILRNSDTCSTLLAGTILTSTHQEGRYPTQYSNIYDLKKRRIYLFYFHNYEEYLTLDLISLFKRGEKQYNIPALFSRVKLIYPSTEDETGTSPDIQWQGLADSRYEIIYATDENFSDAETIEVNPGLSGIIEGNDLHAVVPLSLFLIFVFIRRKKIPGMIMIFLLFSVTAFRCNKDEDQLREEEPVEFSHTITDLEAGKTYFWKIGAQIRYKRFYY